MGSGTNKLRVLWICHFLNQSVKKRLSIPQGEKEFAPWITLGIEEFKKRDDIELHIVAPLYPIERDSVFQEDNINYYFIKVGVPCMRRAWPKWFNPEGFLKYFYFKYRVRALVNKLKPDIINLHGAENAYYASSALNLGKYPVLVTIQGFITLNNVGDSNDPELRRRIEVEEEILRGMKHFGVEATSIERHIRKYNPDAIMHWSHFPFTKTVVAGTPAKEYDLVFFAKVIKMKGIEDLIWAVSRIKHFMPEISLEVIGSTEETYREHLIEMIEDLDLKANVIFRGFIPTQQEVHYEVMKARISVLPTYNDTIPGTIIESMLLGLPVISYETGGIPDLNLRSENIILVPQGNRELLTQEILKLLKDPQRQTELGGRAKQFAEREFDNANSADMLIQSYREVIGDYAG